MASRSSASAAQSTPVRFGAWLRQLREEKGLAQRTVASAADMDSSHYGKVEGGKRLLTAGQVLAVADILGVSTNEMRVRLIAARLLDECGGDHALAASAADFVQENSVPYRTSKSTSQRVRSR